jgi:hypothetical protein
MALRHGTFRLFVLVLILAAALGIGLAGISSTGSVQAQVSTTAVTDIHYADHSLPPCFNIGCLHRVAPQGSVVHDSVVVTSSNPGLDPTGDVTFRWFTDTADCNGSAFSDESVALTVAGGVGTAESSNVGPLIAGKYSYKAIYFPDTAAQALGFATTPAICEQLTVIKVKVTTIIHFADHTVVPCNGPGCILQVAPDGSVVHDNITVNSGFSNRTPTGTVEVAFFAGGLHCGGVTPTFETITLVAPSIPKNITTAETSDVGPLAPGDYSYRAKYWPDAAAVSKGLGSSVGPCEQLLVLP